VVLDRIFDWLKDKYGGHYSGCVPDRYLALDVETSGGSKDDLVVMMGGCLVEGGTPQWYEDVIVDWFRYDDGIVPNDWLEDRLRLCEYHMNQNSGFHGVTLERMRMEGRPVSEVIDHYLKLFQEVRGRHGIFLGHCFLTVDAPRITNFFQEFGGADWKFYDDEVLDTAALEKASVKGFLPCPGETVEEYLLRVIRERRSGLKYSLDHCIAKYRLQERYQLDMEQRHTAGFDAMVSHLLMEEYRSMIGC
jgi:hypothetical protein